MIYSFSWTSWFPGLLSLLFQMLACFKFWEREIEKEIFKDHRGCYLIKFNPKYFRSYYVSSTRIQRWKGLYSNREDRHKHIVTIGLSFNNRQMYKELGKEQDLWEWRREHMEILENFNSQDGLRRMRDVAGQILIYFDWIIGWDVQMQTRWL